MLVRPEGEVQQLFESEVPTDALDSLAFMIATSIQQGYDIRHLVTDYDTHIEDILKLFSDNKLTAALIGHDLRRALVNNDYNLAAERLSLLLTNKPSQFDVDPL